MAGTGNTFSRLGQNIGSAFCTNCKSNFTNIDEVLNIRNHDAHRCIGCESVHGTGPVAPELRNTPSFDPAPDFVTRDAIAAEADGGAQGGAAVLPETTAPEIVAADGSSVVDHGQGATPRFTTEPASEEPSTVSRWSAAHAQPTP